MSYSSEKTTSLFSQHNHQNAFVQLLEPKILRNDLFRHAIIKSVVVNDDYHHGNDVDMDVKQTSQSSPLL
ncbi:hypothetical protein DERP_010413 [Dermatophagoides pteronyssinus]|uniref:Uncharacterized protein n=1 Tax=Dermatophagoides pteronyssinus TaxID=6956 RepID=A0ABQ8J4U5_DERPT|nr:hypothetical protein DERP_010413 [Dermatophagoides pteronyssinus]